MAGLEPMPDGCVAHLLKLRLSAARAVSNATYSTRALGHRAGLAGPFAALQRQSRRAIEPEPLLNTEHRRRFIGEPIEFPSGLRGAQYRPHYRREQF